MRLNTIGLRGKNTKKCTKQLINNTVSVLGVATTAIPSGAVAASITGVGVAVGASLGEIGAYRSYSHEQETRKENK